MSFVLVVEDAAGPRGELIVRVVSGSLRVGDVIRDVSFVDQAESMDVSLEVDSIERYEGVFVDELECFHVARVRVHGEVPAGLELESRLRG